MEKRPNQIDRLSDVALFVRVAERGNFSMAAKDWHLSPSTVSKLVDRLEGRLKVRLFDRTPRAVTLTPAGRIFYGKALALLEAAESAQSAVMQEHDDVRGMLRVHAPPVFARHDLARLLPDFLARHPQVRVELFVGLDTPSLMQQGLDVLIHSGHLPDSSMVARQLSTVRWIVCASPAYLARHGTPRRPEDLLRHNCLNFVGREAWNHWQVGGPEMPREQLAIGNVSASDGGVLLEMARGGAGIARLGDFHVRADIDSGRLVPLFLSEAFEEVPVLAAYHHRKHLSARIQAFVDFMAEALEARNRDMDAWLAALGGSAGRSAPDAATRP